MGLVKGASDLPSPSPRQRVTIDSLVEGQFHETSRGHCFVARETFALDHHHGDLPLNVFLDLSPQIAADIGGEPAIARTDLHHAVFLDTETTGLSGGTGTMAFLVGLGFFEDDAFHLYQAFLRDPGDEPSMIELLGDLFTRFQVMVTFNGRGFDVPILETRFILDRRPFPLANMPHLDLLGPARRLWRLALPSCSLGTLEKAILGVHRDQADVPSGIIPAIYRDYLQTGDARDIARILYHNKIDVLSMVTLAARISHAFSTPWDNPQMDGPTFYALSRWYENTGGESERALRHALKSNLSPELRRRALEDLALTLRRADRREEAIEWWQQLAIEGPADVTAPIELAKTFEWHIPRFDNALEWTKIAIERARRWPVGQRREDTLVELEHRLVRLRRKATSSPQASPPAPPRDDQSGAQTA
jgi:uncharacterized protein YprB with RNaseH-like and TPR domain